jgi:cytidylate kinase
MPVIAMTREIGSLGSDVAAGLANRLGLKIIHSEIVVSNIAERLGVQESALLRYVDGSASILERWLINRKKLSRYTSEEILGLAQEGNVLIRGWGAATLLRDMPQVISVRVCAPMGFRVQVMMERLGVRDADAVREEIERYDAAHLRTMRASFDVEREDALLYHIVLNTERLSVDSCVKAVCQLAEGPEFKDQATARSVLANKLLEAKINSTLIEHIDLATAPTGISVSAANGMVTLAGMTSSGGLRVRAEKLAQAIAGVSHIENRIVSIPSRGRTLGADFGNAVPAQNSRCPRKSGDFGVAVRPRVGVSATNVVLHDFRRQRTEVPAST